MLKIVSAIRVFNCEYNFILTFCIKKDKMQLQISCKKGGVKDRVSKFEKAKARIKARPKDYTYTEAKALLSQLGFIEYNKGKTSGSRVKFYREKDKKIILLHKPHPEDIMKPGAVKQLIEYLMELGEIE